MRLLPLEESWRELERGMRLRRVYHWVAHRIHTRGRLSVLCLLLARVIEHVGQTPADGSASKFPLR